MASFFRIALMILALPSADGFVPIKPMIHHHRGQLVTAVDPQMVDAAIAVVSAAAGAATQMPRIQRLEKELKDARSALSESEQELVRKIALLEEQLFKMDEEFEAQTAKIKKRFDTTLKEEVERVRKKVKEEFQFSMEIKVAEEREKMLQEKLEFLGSFNGEKDAELVSLRLREAQVKKANEQLEQALLTAQGELKKLRDAETKGWWPF